MVITNDQEYRVGVKNTLAFIRANPVSIALQRPQVVTTAAGGIKRIDPVAIPTQQFRIVPMSGLVWDRSKVTPDEGNIADVTEQLIGLPDADVQKNDFFAHDAGWFKVVHVSPVRGYRKEARLQYTDTKPVA